MQFRKQFHENDDGFCDCDGARRECVSSSLRSQPWDANGARYKGFGWCQASRGLCLRAPPSWVVTSSPRSVQERVRILTWSGPCTSHRTSNSCCHTQLYHPCQCTVGSPRAFPNTWTRRVSTRAFQRRFRCCNPLQPPHGTLALASGTNAARSCYLVAWNGGHAVQPHNLEL